MAKIFIGGKIIPKKNPIKELIRCCSCHKYYDFKGNIFSSIKGKILVCPHCELKHKIDFKPFNSKINNLIKINKLNLGAIDIGSAAIDRPENYNVSNSTLIFKDNPANVSGKITSIEIWAFANMSALRVATFYLVSGTNFSTRDWVNIGSVTAGSKQTFEVNLDVEAGDYIGIVDTGIDAKIEKTNSGAGAWHTLGAVNIPCTNVTFGSWVNYTYSVYGTGITLPKNATGKADISTSIISVLSRGKIESASAKASLASGIIGILSRGKIENASGKSDIISSIIVSLSRGKIEDVSGKSNISSNIISILFRIKKANTKASISTLMDSILSRGQIENANGRSDLSTSIIAILSRGKIESISGKVDISSLIDITITRGKVEIVSGKSSLTTDIDAILKRIIYTNGKADLDTLCDIIVGKEELYNVNGKAYIHTSIDSILLRRLEAIGKADIDSLIDVSLKGILRGKGKSIFDTLIEIEVARHFVFIQATLGITTAEVKLGIER